MNRLLLKSKKVKLKITGLAIHPTRLKSGGFLADFTVRMDLILWKHLWFLRGLPRSGSHLEIQACDQEIGKRICLPYEHSADVVCRKGAAPA